MAKTPESWMQQAIELAINNVNSGRGGPFGALVVKGGELLATGVNLVTSSNDPTAHAEVVAIRAACKALNSFQLDGCELYTSCEPCPMCLGAIYWARPKLYYYACTRQGAAAAGFDDAHIYDQVSLEPEARTIPGYCVLPDEGLEPFLAWTRSIQRVEY